MGDPLLAALLLGKSSEATERAVELDIVGNLPAEGPVSGRDLVTVVGNLVDNAFDAVTGRDERRVSLVLEGDADEVVVVVGDSGPGLDGDEAQHVLERGWTTKAGDPATGGRGVGLALVGQVVRRHHGEVTIRRSTFGGAEFRVRLRRPPR